MRTYEAELMMIGSSYCYILEDGGRVEEEFVFGADHKDHRGQHKAVRDAAKLGTVVELDLGDDAYWFTAQEKIIGPD